MKENGLIRNRNEDVTTQEQLKQISHPRVICSRRAPKNKRTALTSGLCKSAIGPKGFRFTNLSECPSDAHTNTIIPNDSDEFIAELLSAQGRYSALFIG